MIFRPQVKYNSGSGLGSTSYNHAHAGMYTGLHEANCQVWDVSFEIQHYAKVALIQHFCANHYWPQLVVDLSLIHI